MYWFLRSKWIAGFVATLVALQIGCGGDNPADDGTEPPVNSIGATPGGGGTADPTPVHPQSSQEYSPPGGSPGQLPTRPKQNLHPVVTIKTTQGDIKLRLDAEKAPITVDNFLSNYVDRGYYDQTVFHYVEDGFMIAGGGFTADLQPKEARAEILNEAHNGLKNKRYTIAMARNPEYVNSATSQFWINLADNSFLDYTSDEDASTYGYCVFGEVIAGQEVVDRIAKTPVHDTEAFPKTPTTPVVVQTVVRDE
ncbi:MAG: peptidylprolyl isomerase [Pirellulaceae bacterium]